MSTTFSTRILIRNIKARRLWLCSHTHVEIRRLWRWAGNCLIGSLWLSHYQVSPFLVLWRQTFTTFTIVLFQIMQIGCQTYWQLLSSGHDAACFPGLHPVNGLSFFLLNMRLNVSAALLHSIYLTDSPSMIHLCGWCWLWLIMLMNGSAEGAPSAFHNLFSLCSLS